MNMKRILKEGLDYHDLEGMMDSTVSVDEYSAKMGKDSDIVTLAFVVYSEMAGRDLAEWFERGYEWVLDASISEGELSPGKWVVFVEMNRRSTVPEHIVELITDLKTLTGLDVSDWTVVIDEDEHEPDANVLKQLITISPHQYRIEEESEGELNEMREIAGIGAKPIYDEADVEIKNFKAMAGL
jgi:hypothetical protein